MILILGHLTPDMIKARTVSLAEEGTPERYRINRFSVLYPDGVLLRVTAKGLEAEWIFEQLRTLA